MTIMEFMGAHMCSKFEELQKKFPNHVGLSIDLDNGGSYRFVIAFNEIVFDVESNEQIVCEAVHSINNMLVYTADDNIGGFKIISINPISKKDLTAIELYQMFSRDAYVFEDTAKFQKFYGLMDEKEDEIEPPYFIDKDKLDVKIGHLKEELAEIEKAAANGDLPEFADGIIDLIYVAAGLGALCRLPMTQLWNDVQNSNMVGKERVTSLNNATKRGTTFDVRKGPNWVSPRGADIIKVATEKRQNKKIEG